MQNIDLAWLAGIIDGEGSIYITKHKRKARGGRDFYLLNLKVASSDPFMAPECQRIVQRGTLYYRNDKRENHSNTISWEVSAATAYDILKEVLPYLRVKQPQAELAIRFHEETKQKPGPKFTEADRTRQRYFRKMLQQAKRNLKYAVNNPLQ